MREEGILSVVGISKSFGGVSALDSVSFEAHAPGILAIIGPNGAGKSTLIDILSGFERPDSGTCLWNGHPLSGKPPAEVVRMGLARTFQSLRLAYALTAEDNVLAAAESAKALRARQRNASRLSAEPRQVAREALERLGLAAVSQVPAIELSFGMQKALSVACVLALDPEVVLLDEPFGGLHTDRIDELVALLQLLATEGKLIVFIEHDLRAVRAAAERVMVMVRGRVVATGETGEILNRPDVREAYLG